MTAATLILIALAAALLVYAYRRGDGSHREGVVTGAHTLRRTAPLLLLAFAITGYVDALAPQQLVESLIGPQSGLGGILVAEGAGTLLPGGPYVIFPLIDVLYDQGAGLVPVITMVTGWATLSLLRLAFEIPFMGWRFTAIRWGLSLLLPISAGIAVGLFFAG